MNNNMNTGSLDPQKASMLSFEDQLEGGLSCRLALILLDGRHDASETARRLRTWIDRRREQGWLILWQRLEDVDDDPRHFLRRLLDLLDEAKEIEFLDLEDGLSALINYLADADPTVLIVLEDYAVIQSAETHDLIARMLDYLPPNVHVYLLSPSEPPIAIPRLRVRRQLIEIK